MRKAFLSGITTFAAIMLGGAAHAADLKAPAPVAPPFSWNGCYIGASGGWARAEHDLSTFVDANSNMDTAPRGVITRIGSGSISDDNWIFGGQAGCNFQLTSIWIVGAELDFSGTGLKAQRDTGNVVTGTFPGLARSIDEVSVDWLGTLRFRLGLAVAPQALIYATGGGAFARLDASKRFLWNADGCQPVVNGLNECHVGSKADTVFGWTVGGGLEWAFAGNWSVKAEYLFVQLNDDHFRTFNRTILFTGQWADHPFDTQLHIARVGLNYRFGDAPVAARY